MCAVYEYFRTLTVLHIGMASVEEGLGRVEGGLVGGEGGGMKLTESESEISSGTRGVSGSGREHDIGRARWRISKIHLKRRLTEGCRNLRVKYELPEGHERGPLLIFVDVKAKLLFNEFVAVFGATVGLLMAGEGKA